MEFQNLKKDSKNFVSDRNLLWKPELRWRSGKLEMEETEAVVRTFLCLQYLISFTFLLDTLSILDFDEGFSSLLILLLRNMFNLEIWVMYICISLYISLLNYQMWVRREEDDPYQSIEEQLLSIDEVEVFRGQKNRLVLLL